MVLLIVFLRLGTACCFNGIGVLLPNGKTVNNSFSVNILSCYYGFHKGILRDHEQTYFVDYV